MRRSFPQLILGLFAAPLLLIASTASAAPGKEACANLELVGIIELNGRQLLVRLDLEDGEVRTGIPQYDLGLELALVDE